MVKIFL